MSSSRLKVVCVLEACGQLEPRNRRYWVHPFIAEREASDKFDKFYRHIRNYECKFFDYYRMSMKSFDELLNVLRTEITKQDTSFRKAISAEERLTITLRYLSTGMSFTSLQYEFYVARPTIASIVRETCQAVWRVLQNIEMPRPTMEMWLDTADKFYKKTNFPNCVGALDGKHVRCINPAGGGSNFFNYKKYFSIVLLTIVDANLRFIAIDVGALGKNSDSIVFKDSSLGKKFYSDSLNIPPPRCLPNTNMNPQPFVIVADDAFKLSTNLLCPYPSRKLEAKKRVYNYRHSRCRRTVECAFGVLVNKWRIFHTPILVEPDFVDDIVKACCILHNFVRRRDGLNFDDTQTHPFLDIIDFGQGPRGTGLTVRDYFANYFMDAGSVSFQSSYMF